MNLSKWDLILIIVILSSIFVSFAVQLSQRYLISGDNWVVLKASVEIISGRNLYAAWNQHYPLMFGFILAGLSIASGLPVLNTNVLLFPFIGLNLITFYVLIKKVFKVDTKVAVTSCILYCCMGGLGGFFQFAIYNGALPFWTISYLTQDMYFSGFFWYNIQFSFKSLALTTAYSSVVMFVVSINFNAVFRNVSFRFGRGIMIISNLSLVFVGSFLALPGISVMYFWSLFRTSINC